MLLCLKKKEKNKTVIQRIYFFNSLNKEIDLKKTISIHQFTNELFENFSEHFLTHLNHGLI